MRARDALPLLCLRVFVALIGNIFALQLACRLIGLKIELDFCVRCALHSDDYIVALPRSVAFRGGSSSKDDGSVAFQGQSSHSILRSQDWNGERAKEAGVALTPNILSTGTGLQGCDAAPAKKDDFWSRSFYCNMRSFGWEILLPVTNVPVPVSRKQIWAG